MSTGRLSLDSGGLIGVLNRCSADDVTSLTSDVPPGLSPQVTHVEQLPPKVGRLAPWPTWVPDELRTALRARGIDQPWSHQVQAADLAHAGRDVVLATGTASGKSLAYQLPVLSAVLTEPRATALYISPTKALAADQLGALERLALPAVRVAPYDGDTPDVERDWARAHASWVLTNPDMLHRGLLPGHRRWERLLRRLRYVVVDECHAYRGVFGSHVGLVLRRLVRLARAYGSDPVIILASATVADPATAAERLVGRPVVPSPTTAPPGPGPTSCSGSPSSSRTPRASTGPRCGARHRPRPRG